MSPALELQRLAGAGVLKTYQKVDRAPGGQKLLGHEIDGGTADVPGHPHAVGQHDRNLEPDSLLAALFLVHKSLPLSRLKFPAGQSTMQFVCVFSFVYLWFRCLTNFVA